MPSAAQNHTVCMTFRYPDGSREYVYLASLPTGGQRVSRHGTDYIVRSIGADGAGNTMVTLDRATELCAEEGSDLGEVAPS
jgi:hypothetical protein